MARETFRKITMALKSKVGFIGFGRMGSALVHGALSSNVLKVDQITAFDVDLVARQKIKKQRLTLAKSAVEVVQSSDLIFLCVKPQQMGDLVKSLGAALKKKGEKKCFASIAAGISLKDLEKSLGVGVPVLRVMPNTPALIGAGMSVFCLGRSATEKHKADVETILKSVGEAALVSEDKMDAVTAVSGSGPAYGFYLAEAMIEAGVELGLSEELAERLVRQTLYGAGLMLKKSDETAKNLRLHVTSPGGTTAAAVAEFENKGFKTIVSAALYSAAERSKELSQGN